ncbi:MAG TPA: hypothetical protein VL860_07020 [Planctomycetota bacterium]|nr:hypothetical protein [Planctomycetota bacterium]
MWWEPILVFGLLVLAGWWLTRRLRAIFRGDKACGGCGKCGGTKLPAEAPVRHAP